MATKLELISQAMLLIGESPVSDIEADTRASLIASNLYDLVYNDALSASEWNFATKRFELSKLEEVPINEYKYQYQLPSDLVRVLTINEGQGSNGFEINGDRLYSNDPKVILEYIYRVPEVFLPPYFAMYVVYALAKIFAIPVTQNVKTLEAFTTLAEQQLGNARFTDSTTAPLDGWYTLSDLGFANEGGDPKLS